MDTSLAKPLETVKDREDWHAAVHGPLTIGHYSEAEQQQMSLSLSFLTCKMGILLSMRKSLQRYMKGLCTLRSAQTKRGLGLP